MILVTETSGTDLSTDGGQNFSMLSNEALENRKKTINNIASKLNNKLRKPLNLKTPYQVFMANFKT